MASRQPRVPTDRPRYFATSLLLGTVATLGCTGSIVVAPSGELPDEPDHAAPAPHPPGREMVPRPATPSGPAQAPAATPGVCTGRRPGPSPLRRLTRFEYDNTVRDLLGEQDKPADAFPGEEQTGGFDNEADSLGVSRLLAEAYLTAGETIAARALARTPALLGCAPTTATAEAECLRAFVSGFGLRAFRRPVTAAERDRLLEVHRTARAAGFDWKTSAEMVLQTILMSPQFLYRLEEGRADPATPGLAPTTSHERASRLAYMLWGSTPDAALLDAAGSGKLDTSEGVKVEAQRLLADPRARQVTRHYYRMWLGLTQVGEQAKDAKLFPDWNAETPILLRHETDTFIERTLFEGDGTLATLLTGSHTFVNATLARFYGVPTTGRVEGRFDGVTLDPMKRAGLLTHASLMSQMATPDHTHPIARGVFVRKALLCAPPPDPPVDIVAGDEASAGPNATARERLAAHRNNPSCSGCHLLIDPLGFGLDNFGADGRFRATEKGGAQIDPAGEIVGTDAAGPFSGPVELVARLAASADVRRCHVSSWFRFAYGRAPTDEDVCTLDQLDAALAGAGGDLRALLIALTQTDTFLWRKVTP